MSGFERFILRSPDPFLKKAVKSLPLLDNLHDLTHESTFTHRIASIELFFVQAVAGALFFTGAPLRVDLSTIKIQEIDDLEGQG